MVSTSHAAIGMITIIVLLSSSRVSGSVTLFCSIMVLNSRLDVTHAWFEASGGRELKMPSSVARVLPVFSSARRGKGKAATYSIARTSTLRW